MSAECLGDILDCVFAGGVDALCLRARCGPVALRCQGLGQFFSRYFHGAFQLPLGNEVQLHWDPVLDAGVAKYFIYRNLEGVEPDLEPVVYCFHPIRKQASLNIHICTSPY